MTYCRYTTSRTRKYSSHRGPSSSILPPSPTRTETPPSHSNVPAKNLTLTPARTRDCHSFFRARSARGPRGEGRGKERDKKGTRRRGVGCSGESIEALGYGQNGAHRYQKTLRVRPSNIRYLQPINTRYLQPINTGYLGAIHIR